MNTKLFLIYTSVIEALTGLSLIIWPSHFILLLFDAKLTDGAGIMLTMIAGAAILSIAVVCWLSRKSTAVHQIVMMLFVYNFLLAATVIYGSTTFKFKSVGLWLVIIFHLWQTIICAASFWKNKTVKK